MDKKSKENAEPRRRRAAAKKSNNKGIITLAVTAVVIIIAVLLCFIVCKSNKTSDVVSKGIHVGDIDLSGKNRQQVEESLAGLVNAFDESEVNLNIESRSFIKSIKAADISLKFSIVKTADKVFETGKKFSLFKSKKKNDVGYSFDYDAVALNHIINEVTAGAGGTLKEHQVTIEGEAAVIESGKAGTGVSAKTAKDVIINSFKPYVKTEVTVPMEQTEPADMTVDYLSDMVKAEKKDAQFVYVGGNVEISQEVDGIELDRKDAEEKLKGFKAGSKPVKVKLIVTPAEVTKQQLSGKLFADVLGQYTTNYNTGQVNRSINVELAAKHINGKVLLPDEVFSYNETVGPRTAERGFKAASVYVGSTVESGLGGGICQTCSTLYPAVLYADLEVVERSNHSLEVSYVPLGMDATVAWGSLDFKFKNSTTYPVKIQSSYGGGKVTISILGTKENKNKKVEIVTERTSYIPFTTKDVPDPALLPGERVEQNAGFNGSTYNTYKVYYENGVEVERKYIGRSVYRMVEKVYNVGVDENGLIPTEPNVSVEQPPSDTSGETAPPEGQNPNLSEPTVGTVDAPVSTVMPTQPSQAPEEASGTNESEYPDGV